MRHAKRCVGMGNGATPLPTEDKRDPVLTPPPHHIGSVPRANA